MKKTIKLLIDIFSYMLIIVLLFLSNDHEEQLRNFSYQDKVNKIEIKYLKGLLKFQAEIKQEKLEEEVSIVKTRSIIP